MTDTDAERWEAAYLAQAEHEAGHRHQVDIDERRLVCPMPECPWGA